MKYEDILEKVVIILGAISLLFLLSLVMSLPVMWLWNSTMPDLFGFKEITWWTSWKMLMLISFLTPLKMSAK